MGGTGTTGARSARADAATATIVRTRRIGTQSRASRCSPRVGERPRAKSPSHPNPKHTPAPETRRFRAPTTRRPGEARDASPASATSTRLAQREHANGTHHLDEVPCLPPRTCVSKRARGRARVRFSRLAAVPILMQPTKTRVISVQRHCHLADLRARLRTVRGFRAIPRAAGIFAYVGDVSSHTRLSAASWL